MVLLGVIIHFVIGRRGDGPLVLLGVVMHFVIGGLTDVSGMVGIDFDLQNFSVDTAGCSDSIRGGGARRRGRMAPLEAAAPRPRPRPGSCWVGVVDVAAPPVRLASTSTRHLVLVVMDLVVRVVL